jgi:hypothetical protein
MYSTMHGGKPRYRPPPYVFVHKFLCSLPVDFVFNMSLLYPTTGKTTDPSYARVTDMKQEATLTSWNLLQENKVWRT